MTLRLMIALRMMQRFTVGLSEQSVLEALAVRDDAATELSDARERLKLWDGVSFYGPDPDYIDAQDFYRKSEKQRSENYVNGGRSE